GSDSRRPLPRLHQRPRGARWYRQRSSVRLGRAHLCIPQPLSLLGRSGVAPASTGVNAPIRGARVTLGGQVVLTYRLISGDSHINEPPNLWLDRVPAKFKDRAPHMEHFDDGDAWVMEGAEAPINFGANSNAGLPPEERPQWLP